MNGLSNISTQKKPLRANSAPESPGLSNPGFNRPAGRARVRPQEPQSPPSAGPVQLEPARLGDEVKPWASENAAVVRQTDLTERKLVLVGFGPHCRRTHISFFQKHNMRPSVIVELESGRESAQAFIREMNWPTELVTIDDRFRNNLSLPGPAVELFDARLNRHGLTHAIIASEPKGHLMYLRYFLDRGLDILADKPIMAFSGLDDPRRVGQLKNAFKDLVGVWSRRGGQFKLLCQRSEHIGYQKIFQLLGQVVEKFDLPITYLNINACDGNWVMPHDLDYENHPYKYGYGKLFHSGYHYVALMANFLEINKRVSPGKTLTGAELSGHFVRPDDLMALFTPEDLAGIFDDYDPQLAQGLEGADLSRYGECDFMANLRFLNANGRTMTTAGLNVLQTGFSRRAWHQTKADRYKGNGRVRHEHVNAHVGPLMNIQVHSYQAKECRDRADEEWGAGGLDHFDIDIYRNAGLLGGPAHERFTVRDLHDFSGEKYFVGLNELAREKVLMDFFHQRDNGADINHHLTAMEIFCQLCALQAHFTRSNRMATRRFPLPL